jgi:diguanylate cyclase (GGDEF)-like protein
MTTPILETRGFALAVFDALTSHICVLDSEGVIIAANRAWRQFGADNAQPSNYAYVGSSYLAACGAATGPDSDEAGPFALGVRAVLTGERELFEMEYPCHSASANRWFLARVTPIGSPPGGAVISHIDITQRKLVEFELERLASTDLLTGLPNRRYCLSAGAHELQRLRRFKIPASLVIFDLDHFKAINDTYGHAAGDETLRRISEACRSALRQIDVLARYGGEEFVAILPGTDEIGAANVAAKLADVIRDMSIEMGERQWRLTASFGVAEVWVNDIGVDECLSRADSALYLAKRAGRDRAATYSSAQLSAA